MKHAILNVLSGEYQGSAFPLLYQRVTLGSAPDCHIVLGSYNGVAAHHAEILWDGTAFSIEDRSGQEIGVNGVLIGASQLASGGVVQIGDFRARLQYSDVPAFAETSSVADSGASSVSAPVRRSSNNEQRWATIGGLAFGAAAVTVFLLLAQFSASDLVRGQREQPTPPPISEPEVETVVVDDFSEEQSHENALRASCQSNLKQVALAAFQYMQDYDEKYPLVAAVDDPNVYGWSDALQPYLRSTVLFQCPSEPNIGASTPREIGYTDYFYNTRLSGERQSVIPTTYSLIMFGDGGNRRGRYNSNGCRGNDDWPVSSCEMEGAALIPDGGATRHLSGGNYAFADGHVKWLRGEYDGTSLEIGNIMDLSRTYSFGFNKEIGEHTHD